MFSPYRVVMDSRFNPLRNLHPAQRFQLMIALSIMWTTIFSAGAGAWLWYGELIVLHVLMVFGVFATGFTFHRANRITTYRDQPRADGTARYDDVWGG